MKKENSESEQTNASSEELKKEAKDFFEIASAYRKERFSHDVKEVNTVLNLKAYVMNRRWMKEWKSYVNYTHVKRKLHYSFYGSNTEYEPNHQSFPGPIANNKILVPMTDFLNDGNPNNPENIVVKNELDMVNDLRLVNKTMWEFFYTRYGGGPCIIKGQMEEKSKHSSYSYSRKVIEVMFRKVLLTL